MEDVLFRFINEHIKDLYEEDCGAILIRESKGHLLVDIEWADGVSSFNLFKVLELINNKGMISKKEIVDYCLD
jgi:hypothetical protein